jgi:O-antigen/teichoic acid export membrane protein
MRAGVAGEASSLKAMVRICGVYGVSSILSRSIAFLLLPLYTRALSPEEYGIRAMVVVGIELTMLLTACGLKEAINRFYAGADGTRAAQLEAASTGILTHIGLIGSGVTLGVVFAPALSAPLLGDAALAPYLRLGLISGFLAHVHEAAFVYLRAERRASTVALVSLGSMFAMVVLNFLFVVGLRLGVAGIFYAEIIVFAVTGVTLTVRTLREVGVSFSPRVARAMLRFGIPLMLVPCASLFVSRADVMFLTHYGSLAYVGIYSLSVQCAQVLQLAVIYPFRYFWDSTQFQIAREDPEGRTFRRMFQWLTTLAIVAAFGCAVAAEHVIHLMAAPVFHDAARVVPILVIAYVLEGIYLFFNSALLVRNRTGLVGLVAISTAAVNLGANALLVPAFLAVGAATARVVAQIVMVGMTFVLAQRLWRQHPDFRGLAIVSGSAVALFLVAQSLPDGPLLLVVAAKALLVLVLCALAIGTGAVDRAEARRAFDLVRRRLRRRSRRGHDHRALPEDARPVPAPSVGE